MKQRLLNEEYRRFGRQVFSFIIISAVLTGILYLILPLINDWVNSDSCIWDLSGGGICIIDSILLGLLASIGLSVLFTLLKSALAGIIIFITNLRNIHKYTENTPPPPSNTIVACPKCYHKSRIPANIKIIFTCSACKTKHTANNGVIVQ